MTLLKTDVDVAYVQIKDGTTYKSINIEKETNETFITSITTYDIEFSRYTVKERLYKQTAEEVKTLLLNLFNEII